MSRAKTAVDEMAATGPVNANTAEGDAAQGGSAQAAEATSATADRAAEPAATAGGAEEATASAEGSTAGREAAEPGAAAGGGAAASGAASTAAEPQADPAEGEAAETDTSATTAPAEAEAADSEATEPEAAETDRAEADPDRSAKSRPAWRRLPVLLLAAAVVLTGAGVWFTLEARSVAANSAAANLALTDVGATADVTSAVTLAMNRIFSYSYDRTDVTEKAAAAVLRGTAKDSYDKLFAQVREKAPEQKLVLTSRVSAIAVQELKNGHARLLVFLDQSAVRADNNATDSAAAQLSVTAERTGDGWVVTELEPR